LRRVNWNVLCSPDRDVQASSSASSSIPLIDMQERSSERSFSMLKGSIMKNLHITVSEYSLLLAIDSNSEDICDYVKLSDATRHFAYVSTSRLVLESCIDKKLVVLSSVVMERETCVALTARGIHAVMERKIQLKL
jgi:hypothetical protein